MVSCLGDAHLWINLVSFRERNREDVPTVREEKGEKVTSPFVAKEITMVFFDSTYFPPDK